MIVLFIFVDMIANNLDDLLGRKVTRKDLFLKEVIIADGVENICGCCLCRIKGMTSIVIPKSVVKLDIKAFWGCHNLTTLVIPESVNKIDPFAFRGCENLKSIIVDKNNKFYDSREDCNAIICTINNTLILGCDNTIIPNGVKRIATNAFFHCRNMVSLKIPQSVHTFSINTIGCRDSIQSIEVDINNTHLDSRNNSNAIIRKNGNELIFGCNCTSIPYGVESIGYRAFECCKGLTSIIIPDGVKTINERAFWGCTKLASITIPDSVTCIGDKAFSYGNNHRIYYIPKGSRIKFESLLPQYTSKLVEI